MVKELIKIVIFITSLNRKTILIAHTLHQATQKNESEEL